MMRTLQRIAVLCFYVVSFVALFYFGREHQIFIDNNSIEADGKGFRALELVMVTIDDGEPIELMPRFRDVVKVVGPSFRFKVEVMDQFGEEVEKLIEGEFSPGFAKNIMLSLPLLASGRGDYFLPPPAVVIPPREQETISDDESEFIMQE